MDLVLEILLGLISVSIAGLVMLSFWEKLRYRLNAGLALVTIYRRRTSSGNWYRDDGGC